MFRFENLEIWKFVLISIRKWNQNAYKAIEIAEKLLDIADQLEAKKLFRFAEQLRDAALSMPNNIAEGSGSDSDREFAQFINYARRSAFENANMIIIFARRKYLSSASKNKLLTQLDSLCRMMTNFKKSLRA